MRLELSFCAGPKTPPWISAARETRSTSTPCPSRADRGRREAVRVRPPTVTPPTTELPAPNGTSMAPAPAAQSIMVAHLLLAPGIGDHIGRAGVIVQHPQDGVLVRFPEGMGGTIIALHSSRFRPASWAERGAMHATPLPPGRNRHRSELRGAEQVTVCPKGEDSSSGVIVSPSRPHPKCLSRARPLFPPTVAPRAVDCSLRPGSTATTRIRPDLATRSAAPARSPPSARLQRRSSAPVAACAGRRCHGHRSAPPRCRCITRGRDFRRGVALGNLRGIPRVMGMRPHESAD